MTAFRQRRAWFWIAIAAIVIALVALLVPHGHSSVDQAAWIAILPVFFVGLIAPLDLLPLAAVLCIGYAADAPALAPSFQRPPPLHLA